jgi:hypothetical protein
VPPEHDDDESNSEESLGLEGEGEEAQPEATQPTAEVDPNGQMPGQLPTGVSQVEEVRTYAQQKERAKEKVRQLLGQQVPIRQCNQTVTWQVIQESVAEVEEEVLSLGLKDLSMLNYPKSEAIGKNFLRLFSERWQDKLDKINSAIEKQNSTEKGNKVCLFSEAEFLVAVGLIIGAVEYGNKGSSLWLNGEKKLIVMNGVLFFLTLILIDLCLSIVSNNFGSFFQLPLNQRHSTKQKIHGGGLLMPYRI